MKSKILRHIYIIRWDERGKTKSKKFMDDYKMACHLDRLNKRGIYEYKMEII